MQHVGNIFLVFALNELCRMGAENLNLSEIYRKLGPKCIIKVNRKCPLSGKICSCSQYDII